MLVDGVVREISPGRRPDHAHLHRQSHAEGPAAADALRHEHRRPLKRHPRPSSLLPLSVLFDKGGAPAVWVFDHRPGSVSLKPVTVSRYETDSVVVASGLAKGDIVVTAGVNTLREGQKVRLAEAAASAGSDLK